MSAVSSFEQMQEGRPTGPLVRGYEVIIGFETHAQLSTASKIFSRASTAFGAEPKAVEARLKIFDAVDSCACVSEPMMTS